ncbi:MAG: DegV family protein [Lachnospira sp.]|nr:DegV family protein [Lachnospira sp.]
MKWIIVTDSSSDMACMKHELNGEVGFDTVPLKLLIGEDEFVDDEKLDVDVMMKALAAYPGKSGSAAPSPGEWKEAFEKADFAVAVTISSNLSGSYASAQAGIDMLKEEYPDKKVLLVDSRSTGPAMMMLALHAYELAKQDIDFDGMKNAMDKYFSEIRTLFVLENMDNLVKNGRVSKLAGGMASLLGIKVMGEATPEGTLGVLKKARGKFQSHDNMIQAMFEKGYKGGLVKLGHCHNDEKAQYVKDKIKAKFANATVDIYKLRGLDSFYAEEGGIIMSYEIV